MHLCAELIAVSMMLEPLGEVGANFSLQLSSRTQFTKINNKKVIAENQCEKHKKSSLVVSVSTYETRGPGSIPRVGTYFQCVFCQNISCRVLSQLGLTNKLADFLEGLKS